VTDTSSSNFHMPRRYAENGSAFPGNQIGTAQQLQPQPEILASREVGKPVTKSAGSKTNSRASRKNTRKRTQ
jgi:hypothetical protein